MDHVKNVLEKFAAHTRHTSDELLDPSKMAQKYVAAHVGKLAYDCVSDDYDAVKLRTHNPPLNMYTNTIDVPTFVQVMRHVTVSAETPLLNQFKGNFFAKPAEMEKWKWMERPDQWKENAAFVAMALCKTPNFGHVADAVGVNRDALKQFAKKQDEADLQIEIGLLLQHTKVPIKYLGTPLEATPHQSVSKGEDTKNIITLNKTATTTPTRSMSELRPFMEHYRIRSGLNKTVSTQKLAKQMMISALCVPDECVPTSVLTTHQKTLAPLEGTSELKLVTSLVDAFDKHPTFDPNKSARCEAMSAATLNNMWDSRELLKHVLHAEEHVKNPRQLLSYQKCKLEGTNDAELVKAIASL